jgi:hypothetical protein
MRAWRQNPQTAIRRSRRPLPASTPFVQEMLRSGCVNLISDLSATSTVEGVLSGERPLIKAKKVVLKNDYIHHVIDVYHI